MHLFCCQPSGCDDADGPDSDAGWVEFASPIWRRCSIGRASQLAPRTGISFGAGLSTTSYAGFTTTGSDLVSDSRRCRKSVIPFEPRCRSRATEDVLATDPQVPPGSKTRARVPGRSVDRGTRQPSPRAWFGPRVRCGVRSAKAANDVTVNGRARRQTRQGHRARSRRGRPTVATGLRDTAKKAVKTRTAGREGRP